MSDQKTVAVDWLEQPVLGYMIKASFSKENQQKLAKIINQLHQQLPDAIWPTPLSALHITLLDWITPVADYEQKEELLFKEIWPDFDRAMESVLRGQKPIKVRFDKLKAYPAAITVEGSDDGSFKRIRDEFLANVKLLPNTKLPPNIIHSSLCRFKKPVELAIVADALANEPIDFEQTIDTFELVKETVAGMLEYELIKTYSLD